MPRTMTLFCGRIDSASSGIISSRAIEATPGFCNSVRRTSSTVTGCPCMPTTPSIVVPTCSKGSVVLASVA